jgi:hypothetical protein
LRIADCELKATVADKFEIHIPKSKIPRRPFEPDTVKTVEGRNISAGPRSRGWGNDRSPFAGRTVFYLEYDRLTRF